MSVLKLIFVYNANSGKANAFLDSVHKIVRPDTYQCNLCAITFNTFSEKQSWKDFRSTHKADMVFLHKDEFLKKYRSKWLPKYEFPLVLAENNGELELLISAEELNNLAATEDLIDLIRQRSDRN